MAARPSHTFARYLRQARDRKGWSQRECVAHLQDRFGVRLDPAALARIESGDRGLSLDEALVLSALLGVAPVHMVVPRDDEEDVLLADKQAEEDGTAAVTAEPEDARRWIAGRMPLTDQDDPVFFFAEAPRQVYEMETSTAYRKVRLVEAGLAHAAMRRAHGDPIPDELLDDLMEDAEALRREVSRYVRDERRRKEADANEST